MKNKYFIHLSSVLLICLSLNSSCKKFIEVDPPSDMLTTEATFSNDQSATAAVRGIYSQIMQFNNFIGNGAVSIYPGLSSDEIKRSVANINEDPFTTNSLLPSNFILNTNLWKKGYYHIYQANVIRENLEKSSTITPVVKKQLLGETLFFRAFFHFYLMNLFGPVPLVTTADYRVNSLIVRTDTSVVYAQIIQDLQEASQLLSSEYLGTEKVRVNKWASKALLARVFLYLKNWGKAESEATAVINSGLYNLATLNKVFTPNNSEAILQFIPASTQIFNTAEAFLFLPVLPTVRPNYSITNTLLTAFETSDQRKTEWISSNVVGGITYQYPSKYKIRSGNPGAKKSEYNIVLRLSELFLIRSEARLHNNNLPGALSDLNLIRQRAGLPPASIIDSSSLFTAIEQQRQVEFFCEWGHRWFDLKRWGKADAVLSLIKGSSWQPTDKLYPIPSAEILANPALAQNPGY